MNERSIFDLDSIIEWLSCNGEFSFDALIGVDPDKAAEDARMTLDDALEASHMTGSDLEDAAGYCAIAYDAAGFNRGFRAGARLVLQMLAIGRPEPGKSI